MQKAEQMQFLPYFFTDVPDPRRTDPAIVAENP